MTKPDRRGALPRQPERYGLATDTIATTSVGEL
jgi:hypothetical protein